MDQPPLIKEGLLLQMASERMDEHPNHAMDLMHFFHGSCLPDPSVSADFSFHGCGGGAGGSAEEDRLSVLADEILRNVVSRLPAKDAARTAALSSRWRSLWRSAPLVLADALLVPASSHGGSLIRDAESSSVIAAASRVLEAHPGPFRHVDLTSRSMDAHRAELARWFYLLAVKGVGFPLPSAIFSLASIKRRYLGVWTAAIPTAAVRPHSEDPTHLEYALLELTASRPDGAAITWSVHRATIFGFSTRSASQLWPTLAKHFQVGWSGYDGDGEDKRFRLVKVMAGKEAVWAQILEEKELVEAELDDITSRWFVDAVINAEEQQLQLDKDHGFLVLQNTLQCNGSERRGKSMCNVQAHIWMMFIVCTFFVTQANGAAHDTCPKQSVSYYILPQNTCPAVYVAGDHWCHAKATRQIREFHQAPFYFGEIFNTRCTQLLNIILVLGCLINWSAIWKLNPTKRVRFFCIDRMLILVWIDMTVVSTVYYGSWMLYGHLLSQYPDYNELGRNISLTNFLGCTFWVFMFLMMLLKYGKDLKARCTFYRILPLVCVAILFIGLKDTERDEAIILCVGIFGFLAMLLMYTFKWAITEYKMASIVLNICAIPVLLSCFELGKLQTCYGWTCVGNICFRVIEMKKSYSLVPKDGHQKR